VIDAISEEKKQTGLVRKLGNNSVISQRQGNDIFLYFFKNQTIFIAFFVRIDTFSKKK